MGWFHGWEERIFLVLLSYRHDMCGDIRSQHELFEIILPPAAL